MAAMVDAHLDTTEAGFSVSVLPFFSVTDAEQFTGRLLPACDLGPVTNLAWRRHVYRPGTSHYLQFNFLSQPLEQIEHLGTVASITRDDGGCTLNISKSGPILDDCQIGDSIAVNGACLTVTEFDKEQDGGWFKVWLANETLQRTDLGVFTL